MLYDSKRHRAIAVSLILSQIVLLLELKFSLRELTIKFYWFCENSYYLGGGGFINPPTHVLWANTKAHNVFVFSLVVVSEERALI